MSRRRDPTVPLTAVPCRHGWLRLFIADLETNPHAQYRVHRAFMWYWLVNLPLVTVLFFTAPGLWVRVGLFVTLVYSIYANFSTDYGAMSAALAAYDDTSERIEKAIAVVVDRLDCGTPGGLADILAELQAWQEANPRPA